MPTGLVRLIPRAFASAILLAMAGCAGASHPPVSPAPSPAVAEELPVGSLLIVGGGPRPASVMERFIQLAGGSGHARIAVVPMASGSPESAGANLVEEMLARGARDAFSLHLDRDGAMRPEAARRLDGVTGVWFSGGSQTRHTAALKDTPVEARLHELYRRGAVLGGTSAGAAIMSPIMITGGERRPGGDRPRDEAWITIDRDNVVTTAGFGFLESTIIDQHFLRRKRNNRLMSLVLEHPDHIGIGIDESTALEVGPEGWTVVGESVVVIYDARSGSVTRPGDGTLGAAGVRMHVLPAGARFDPVTGSATLRRP